MLRATGIGIVLALVALVAVLVLKGSNSRVTVDVSDDGAPLPFGNGSVSVAGSVSSLGKRGSINVSLVSFDDGAAAETLPEGMSFVITPDDPMIAQGAPLSHVLSPNKRYFGYRYSTRSAAAEREAASRLASGQPISFGGVFSGTFFASDAQRADGSIAAFEASHGITFVSPSEITLDKNARYIIAVNDSDTVWTARGVTGWCGNGVQDPQEQCDDGNHTDGDGCSAACHAESSWQNKTNPLDADGNGAVTIMDVSAIVSYLNQPETPRSYVSNYTPVPRYPDVTGDNLVTPQDALVIRNWMATQCGNGTLEQQYGEECDDGNRIDDDNCTNACTLPAVPFF